MFRNFPGLSPFQAGIDTTLTTAHGHTALDVAKKNAHKNPITIGEIKFLLKGSITSYNLYVIACEHSPGLIITLVDLAEVCLLFPFGDAAQIDPHRSLVILALLKGYITASTSQICPIPLYRGSLPPGQIAL